MKLLFRKRSNVKIDKDSFPSIPNETVAVFVDNTEAELASVIALALNLYVQDLQDYEKASITIQKVIKPYSPWSSKIYGLRQLPNFIPGLRARR
jgi:hypothetical protein